MKKIITSYINPDLDGIACMYAYSEFLRKRGFEILPIIFGNPHIEAKFVIDRFNISGFYKEKDFDEGSEVIVVDASSPKDISERIDFNKIIEIIDHRKANDLSNFPNSKNQIELVGSCATLIAEKFFNENVEPSNNSSILLYSAIISNTINFKSKLATQRDIKMADWLKEKIDLSENYIEKMFEFKSKIDEPLKSFLLGDLKKFSAKEGLVGIAQLEIINLREFIKNNFEEIEGALIDIKEQEKLDIVFLNSIDIKDGYNILFALDEKTQGLLEKLLDIKFQDKIAEKEGIIIMRKEIVAELKEIS